MAKVNVPNSGTPLILFIVLIIVLIWMLISFSSFANCGPQCGYFFLPPIVGFIACVCGIIGILLTMSVLMLVTTIAAVIVAVLDVIAVILIFVQFSETLGPFAFTLVVFIISAICWASIAHASWQCKTLYA